MALPIISTLWIQKMSLLISDSHVQQLLYLPHQCLNHSDKLHDNYQRLLLCVETVGIQEGGADSGNMLNRSIEAAIPST